MIDLSKTILITGASGFIGSSFVKSLLQRGASDLVIASRVGTDVSLYKGIPAIRSIELDLSDRDALIIEISKICPVYVYHMAALGTKSIHSHNSIIDLVKANGIATINLIDAAERAESCRAFIYLSTVYEYGPRDEPIHEGMTVEPFGEYAFSKSIGSIYAVNKGKYKKFPISVYRLFSVYGPGDSDRIIPLMLKSFLFSQALTLHDVNKKREFVYIDDLIETLLFADKAVEIPGRAVNIGSGESYTVKELIDMFSLILGKKYMHNITTEESESRLHWIGDQTNMQNLFVIQNTPFKEGIQKMIEYYTTHSL